MPRSRSRNWRRLPDVRLPFADLGCYRPPFDMVPLMKKLCAVRAVMVDGMASFIDRNAVPVGSPWNREAFPPEICEAEERLVKREIVGNLLWLGKNVEAAYRGFYGKSLFAHRSIEWRAYAMDDARPFSSVEEWHRDNFAVDSPFVLWADRHPTLFRHGRETIEPPKGHLLLTTRDAEHRHPSVADYETRQWFRVLLSRERPSGDYARNVGASLKG